MNIFLSYITHDKTYLDLLNISISKYILLFFRLMFFYILKSQRFFRSIFLLDNINFFFKMYSCKKFCRIFQVLKSPQVHKKAQEAYAFKKYSRAQELNLTFFYLNKLYENSFLKILFFSALIHLQKYFFDNALKLKIANKRKLIL